jgi:hypothetical protein
LSWRATSGRPCGEGGRERRKPPPPNPIKPTSFVHILFCFLFNGFGSEGVGPSLCLVGGQGGPKYFPTLKIKPICFMNFLFFSSDRRMKKTKKLIINFSLIKEPLVLDTLKKIRFKEPLVLDTLKKIRFKNRWFWIL